MSDQPARPPDFEGIQGPEPDAPRRPIPDGGLGTAMPGWLQQPPAWKQPPVQTTSRALPEPDTSVIDPSTLLDDDDLPAWLREMAASSPAMPSKDVSADALSVPTTAPGSTLARPIEPPAVSSRFAQTASAPAWSEPNILATLDYTPFRPEPTTPPWWMSNLAIGVLFGAILVTLVYVILVASGVL